MSFLPALETKADVDAVIRNTEDLVVALRFGKADDSVCMRLDYIVCNIISSNNLSLASIIQFTFFLSSNHTIKKLSKAAPELARMAVVYTVDVAHVPAYMSLTLT